MQTVLRLRRAGSSVGLAILAGAVMASATGCGSHASDEAMVAALGGRQNAVAAADPGAATREAPTVPEAAAQNPAVGAANRGTAIETSLRAANQTPVDNPREATAQSAATGTSNTSAKTPTVANKSTVTVGQLGSFSGVLGAVSGAAPKAMAAWAAYTNAHGGLNGHPVRVILADDQGDPATALTLAKRLVESDRILAMVGNVNIFGFPQIEKYMRAVNVPMIGDGIDPAWFQSPVSFPVLTHTPVQIIKGIKSFIDGGVTTVGMTYCLEVSAICTYLAQQVMKSEVGKYIKQSYQVSLVAPSYTSQCLRMKQANLELAYLLMDTAGAARFTKDCATQGYTPKYMLLGLDATADMPTIPSLAAAFIPGATVPPTATGIPGLEKFRKVLGTYAPTLGASGFSGYGFAAGEMLGLVTTNLPDQPTPADILAGLWRVKNESLGGLIVPVTYGKGQPPKIPDCVFIWGTADGKWTAPSGAKPVC